MKEKEYTSEELKELMELAKRVESKLYNENIAVFAELFVMIMGAFTVFSLGMGIVFGSIALFGGGTSTLAYGGLTSSVVFFLLGVIALRFTNTDGLWYDFFRAL